MVRYALASQFWRTVPAWWADRVWQRRVQQVPLRAARCVPAYAKLLQALGPIPPQLAAKPRRIQDSLPLQTSRASYVDVFPAELRGRSGWQRQVASFDPLNWGPGRADSWPRACDELRALREQLVGLLGSWFDARQRRTLLLVSLDEAGWAAGRRITQALLEAIARGHLRASVVELHEAAANCGLAVSRWAGQFDQCVLLCEPSAAAGLMTQLMATWGKVGVVSFGPMRSAERAAMPAGGTACSVWGADEVGPLLALETPLTRMIGQACESNGDLRQALLPGSGLIMGLYQPFPLGPCIEQDGAHLLVSSWGASPLIRYRLGGTGRVIAFMDICRLLQCFGILSPRQIRRLTRVSSACWKLPIVVLAGL